MFLLLHVRRKLTQWSKHNKKEPGNQALKAKSTIYLIMRLCYIHFVSDMWHIRVCAYCKSTYYDHHQDPVSSSYDSSSNKLNSLVLLYCLPTPMTLASGGSPMFPLVVHQPASPSIWPAVQSHRRGLSINPGATMWCVCGCS